LKKIVVLAVVLFGLLLTSTIGVGTAAASQRREDARVVTPPEEPPSATAGGVGVERAMICVPVVAIERSPAIQYLLVPVPPD